MEGGVVAVALEGFDGGPLDQDHHLARLDATGGNNAPTMGRNLTNRTARVGQIHTLVRQRQTRYRGVVRRGETLRQCLAQERRLPASRWQFLLRCRHTGSRFYG